ncbi:uroporphyrinogen-III C-methyltransferase [Uliginosibacterium sp. H1]|uniref:uroporphyrinogen-III C-methyltransferase n=1 Tax=Uliginosibacterium sp. H1 TaxID=3114757 RepID=UPI002E19DF42|nr:uroporphyrinogen-III C-methyltransferase [Uliginosibacterium sp. H1]
MEPVPAPNPPAPPAAARAGRANRWILPLAIIGTAGLLFLAWQWIDTRQELRRTQEELARRLNEGDTVAREARTLADKSHDQLQTIQAKLGAVEARLAETQGLQSTLESVYQEFSKARDERVLADVDQAVGIAIQQLQLAGNIPAALTALQSAEARLGSVDRAQLLPLRRALARDIDRLKALPLADVTSMALQLETMLGRIDSLPLGFEHAPPLPGRNASAPAAAPRKPAPTPRRGSKPEVQSAPVAAASAPLAPPEPGFLSSILSDLWTDFRHLIRIERMDRPDPALLSPSQSAYLRENLRLRLLSARLALLQRDGKVFGEDIRQVEQWLERYFDVSARPVAQMLTELRQLEGARLKVEVPTLADTESALRALKAGNR